jgi:ADP-ribose pyrophosphatase YjhB (NUDIX family)
MESDVVGAGSRLLPHQDYEFIKAKVPILCVDVLLSPKGDPQRVGLIRRMTYNGGEGWCLVGGRVLRNEPLTDAVTRHVLATLGEGVTVDRSTLEFQTIAEYFSERFEDELYDPRKHAVALTYTAFCDGEPTPLGEAEEFGWFEIGELSRLSFGFGQGKVVSRLLEMRQGSSVTAPAGTTYSVGVLGSRKL